MTAENLDPLRSRILSFLYQQVRENKIPQIKKGMVEDLEAFLAAELTQHQMELMADRMRSQAEGQLAVTTPNAPTEEVNE